MINWSEEKLIEQKLYYVEEKLRLLVRRYDVINKEAYILYNNSVRYLPHYRKQYTRICSSLNKINNILFTRNIQYTFNKDIYLHVGNNRLLKINKESEYINPDKINEYFILVDEITKRKLVWGL